MLLVLALVGALDASLRQLLALIALFLLFLLIDVTTLPKLLRGLRISLSFLAAYWVFATLFHSPFPDMVLFTLRIILLIIVTVYVFGNLTLQRVLHDTRSLRKHKFGENIVYYALATGLFIRAYAKYFGRHKPKIRSNVGAVLDNMIEAGKNVFEHSNVIEAQLKLTMQEKGEIASTSSADLMALFLITLMVLINSL